MQKRFNRIMLKIGGESLIGDREYGIDPKAVLDMAEKIKKIYARDIEVAIVIGGGNIFRGLAASKNGIDRATADYMGMLATVMNGLALQDALDKVGVPVRMQSALQMPAVAESFIRSKAIRHMEKGRVTDRSRHDNHKNWNRSAWKKKWDATILVHVEAGKNTKIVTDNQPHKKD